MKFNFKNQVLFILLFVLISCKTGHVKIDLKKTEYSIVLRKFEKRITYIRFPKALKLENKSFVKKGFKRIIYNYNSINKERALNIVLYQKNDDSIIRISNNKKKEIAPNTKRQYIFYTRHFVDSARLIQDQFKPYIEKMLSENKDTLHIGTVKEFKAKHAELFKKLTKDDSISIQFLDGKELGERITVPVKW